MSAWRRKALELFPQLRSELQHPDCSLYLLFGDLKRLALEAHDTRNDETLRKVYCYAEWCMLSKSKDLWNPAGLSFYKHLFDRKSRAYWSTVLLWLSPQVVHEVWGLWEGQLTPDELDELRKMMVQQGLLPRATGGRTQQPQ